MLSESIVLLLFYWNEWCLYYREIWHVFSWNYSHFFMEKKSAWTLVTNHECSYNLGQTPYLIKLLNCRKAVTPLQSHRRLPKGAESELGAHCWHTLRLYCSSWWSSKRWKLWGGRGTPYPGWVAFRQTWGPCPSGAHYCVTLASSLSLKTLVFLHL